MAAVVRAAGAEPLPCACRHVAAVIHSVIPESADRMVGTAKTFPPSITQGGDMTVAELLDYVNVQVISLRQHDDATLTWAKEHADRIAVGLRGEITRVDGRVSEVDAGLIRVRGAVLGPNGRGLREAAVGLGITLVGTVLGLTGLSW